MTQIDLTALDTETNKLGASVANLSAAVDGVSIRFDAQSQKLSTSMTAEQVAAAQAVFDAGTSKLDLVVNGLDTIKTALDAIGAAPAEPVPTTPVIPEVPVEPGS